MPDILNIAAYKFVALDELPALQSALRERAGALGLRGTVLLAPEGINLFVAAPPDAVAGFRRFLDHHPGLGARLAGMPFKQSWSATQPFDKMRVKIKREIIRMNHPGIVPARGRAPAVDAVTLKRWLDAGHDDAGRPVVTLDTRNAFEVDQGGFVGAIDWRIGKFSDFPAAARANAAQLDGKTVVSYCTGGIRCEKAALVLREQGHAHVYQLDGGILKYFEDTGGAHYRGDCFVFDARSALTPDLQAAPAARPCDAPR